MNRIRMDYRISLLIVLVLCCCSAASASDLQPFRDLNEIQRMGLDGDTLWVESRYGNWILNIRTEQASFWPAEAMAYRWAIRTNYREPKSVYWDDNEYILASISLPSWYHGLTYNVVADTYEFRGCQYYLAVVSDEGGIAVYNDVLDIAQRRVYRIPYYDARELVVSDSALWIGHRSGLIKIDRSSGARWEYFVFPRFYKASGWADYRGTRYLTTAEGVLYSFQLSTGVIQQLSLPETVRNAVQDRPNEERWQSRFYLTNPVVKEGRLYVGVFLTNQAGSYMHGNGTSVVAIYDIAQERWSYLALGEKMAVRKLVSRDDGIWCFGNWAEGYEGGCAGFAGGVAVIRNNGEVKRFTELNGIPISAATFTDTELLLLPMKSYYDYTDGDIIAEEDRRNETLYSIDLASGQTTKLREMPVDDPGRNLFVPFRFELSAAEIEGLANWRVQMRQIRVNRPAATVGR